MHYPPETTSIWLVCRMIASVLQVITPSEFVLSFSQYLVLPYHHLDANVVYFDTIHSIIHRGGSG